MKKILVASVFAFFSATLFAQFSFEQTVADLQNPSADVRFKAVGLLKDAAYPEAAVPLAAAVADADNEVQLAAIAAELNIFLAEKVTPRRRVGFVIEVRSRIAADASFSAGRSAMGVRVVPVEVATAMRRAIHDDSQQVSLEATYAFGALAPEVAAADRRELLRAAAPDLAAMMGAPDPAARLAALRVVARVFARRPDDEGSDEVLGDAIIGALNERDADLRAAAMQALGAMRYDRAVQALTDLFQYFKRGALAENALDALARIANPASAPLFMAQLSSAGAPKALAIDGITRLGDPARSADIEKAVSAERNDSVLLAASFATASLSKGSLNVIVDALSRPKQHDQAFGYLLELAPGRAKMFTQGLRDPDARIRTDVADALGLAGDPAAAPMVEAMKQDRDPLVARAAARALVRLGAAR